MQTAHPLHNLWRYEGADPGLNEVAVVGKVDFRDALGGGETSLVLKRIATHRAEIVEGALFAAHDPVAAGQIAVSGVAGFRDESRLIEARRQHVNQVDVAGKLGVLLLGHAAGNEDA